MPLPPASRLGPYEVVSRIGAGGMGEVYRARDVRLGREVALKVLPPDKGGERARRHLLEEARAASALNHPNIITVYDIGSQDGIDYIAMEYVRGRTVHELARKGLELADVIKYAIPIADALARAHAAGITHRDIKPGNIMVNDEGVPKLLDFGLAKSSTAQAASGEPVETQTLYEETLAGLVVGTAPYMSPEQAKGQRLDSRSDIFSFGLVLYMMLTGHSAFPGEDIYSIISRIIHNPPEPIPITEDIPPEMVSIVMRCLRKDPARRYQHAGDLRVALEDLREELAANGPQSPAAPPQSRRRWIESALLVIAGVGATAGGLLWYLNRPRPVTRVPALNQVTFDPGLTTTPAISPDGKLLAYASDRAGRNLDIWVQQLGGGEPIRLTRESADSYDPAFSPDGTTVIFRSEIEGGGLYSVPALGGQVRRIAKDGRRPRSSPDGKWIAYRIGHPQWSWGDGGIFVMPATGGSSRQLHPDFASAGDVIWAPDSRHYLFSGMAPLKHAQHGSESDGRTLNSNAERLDWWLGNLDNNKPIATGGSGITRAQGMAEMQLEDWDPSGKFIIFSARSGDSFNLWKIPISIKAGKVTGAVEPLTFGTTHQSMASISSTGVLVFGSISRSVDAWTIPLYSSSGRAAGPPERLTKDGTVGAPSVSHAGDRMVFQSRRSGNGDIWFRDLRTGTETQITATPFTESVPVISADGFRVAWRAREGNRDNIYYAGLPASGRPSATQKLCDDCGAPFSWSPDGKTLLGMAGSPLKVFSFEVPLGNKAEVASHPVSNIFESSFNSDGKWMLFLVHGPGRSRIYAAPYRAALVPEREWIPLTDGLSWEDKPRWSPDDRAIYFTSDRDGYRCIWAQRLDANRCPLGPAFDIYHSHNARLALMNVAPGLLDISVARDRLIFNQGEKTGNVWLTKLPAQ
jgi:serine/threonine protein kinase/Tol biopolymer transport system component